MIDEQIKIIVAQSVSKITESIDSLNKSVQETNKTLALFGELVETFQYPLFILDTEKNTIKLADEVNYKKDKP